MVALIKMRVFIGMVALALLVCGCKQAVTKTPHHLIKQGLVGAATTESPATVTSSSAPQPTGRQVMLQQLLSQADIALGRKRLTQPPHDNAFDKFSAVLLLDKGNRRAQSGLNAVLLELVGLGREFLARGQLSNAQRQLKTIQEYFPMAELARDLQADIKRAQAAEAARRAVRDREIENDPNRHLVPIKYIRSKDEQALKWFESLAKAIRETDSSILIHARSDSEGRWLYKAIKQSLPGYLVRGDIRVSSTPAIQLMEPL